MLDPFGPTRGLDWCSGLLFQFLNIMGMAFSSDLASSLFTTAERDWMSE
jgi:hypothetical protein